MGRCSPSYGEMQSIIWGDAVHHRELRKHTHPPVLGERARRDFAICLESQRGREVVRAEYSRGSSHGGTFSKGHDSTSVGVSFRHVTEAALLASEIEQLPDLQGFLKLTSKPAWMRNGLAPPLPP